MSQNIGYKPPNAEKLLALIKVLFPLACEIFEHLPAWEKKDGCWTCLKDPNKQTRFHEQVGMIATPGKPERYKWLSGEKCDRLIDHPHHISSHQSRKPKEDKWGGGIRLPSGDALSTSGGPENGDEAVDLVAAVLGEEMTEDQAWEIARISDNQYFQGLYEAAQRRGIGR